MKDDTKNKPPSAPDCRDAVAHLRAVDAASARDRPVIDSKSDGVSPVERDDMGARLHARTLLGQQEFAAFEVFSGRRQQDRDLDREYFGSVNILMEPVVIARAIGEQ